MKYLILASLFLSSLASAQTPPKPATNLADTTKQPPKDINLKEVNIKTRRPLLQMDIDKTIVNVSSMISAASSNTLEVLEKTPGITVSPSGEISLNGRSGVMVLIDGRPNYLSAADLANYLKSLPGSSLDKIELMDNPPAKYDATGNAVINIRLKRNRESGTTGSISSGYSQGEYARTNNSLNLNYNYKKINLFTNLGYSDEKNFSRDDFDRRFFNSSAQPNGTVNLTNDQSNNNGGLNANFGLDYAATKKSTYNLSLNLSNTKRDGDFNYQSKSYDLAGVLQEVGTGNTISREDRTNLSAGLSAVHKLNSAGRELSADLNYLNYQIDGRQDLASFLYQNPSSIAIYSAKADYTHPLKNQARLEAGLKTSFVSNDNDNRYYQISGMSQDLDNSRSNHFKYRENINAAYMTYQKSWSQFGFQFGLRAEHTAFTGTQLGNTPAQGSSFSRSYTNLFPNLMLNYKLDKENKNTVGLMLVRRLNRPNYQSLNPFLFYKDQYTYTSGNPELGPQFQNRIELKYQHKQLLNIGLSYNRFSNVIFQTTEAVGDIFTMMPKNIALGQMILLNLGVSAAPTNWWAVNYTGRVSHMKLNGKVYTETIDFSTNVLRLELNNSFTFGNKWSSELNGYYASSDLNGQLYTGAMYRVNAGIQKKLMKDKASIRLSADDIFHTWVYHYESLSLKQAKYFQTSGSDTQRIGISFSYRFGNELFSRKNKHYNGASDDEKGRL
ncbi:TonB-dependent receptor domain-containing protein [Pedobacter sp. PWIIR3]